MIKKTIKFKDLTDQEVSRDYYFNLTKADVYEINMLANLEVIAGTSDPNRILPIFKSIISRAYGERSDDGRTLIRTERRSEEFLGSEAFSELFVEFIENPSFASEFINGLMPAGMKESIDRAVANGGVNPSPDTQAKIDADRARLEEFQRQQTQPKDSNPPQAAEPVTAATDPAQAAPPVQVPTEVAPPPTPNAPGYNHNPSMETPGDI